MRKFCHTFGDSERLQALMEYTQHLNDYILSEGKKWQTNLPELQFLSGTRTDLGPKFPARYYSYLDELDKVEDYEPVDDKEILQEVARFFRGSLRSGSPNALFNMLPEASIEATAAAWLVTTYNPNMLMDFFGGEALLIEQQVCRYIGKWAGWPQSMGIACNGGKFTLLYAIRLAISRMAPESAKTGLPRDLVILCSEGAHYCVEHAASLLGFGADNCLRVAGTKDGVMDPNELQRVLDEQHLNGRRIAAVICSGGTTINFNCEDTRKILQSINDFSIRHSLRQRPYLHLDSVIGWIYLSTLNMDSESIFAHFSEPETRKRIAEVQRRLEGISGFDSMGVDFHKNGLCPYASSFFIASDRRFMDELGDGNYKYCDKDFHYGQFRTYRYTFENSRPGQGILAAWVNLRRLGRRGYADYLALLHRARNSVSDALARHSFFRVLNENSLGWEVVFAILFAPDIISLSQSHEELAMSFMQECWERVNAGYNLPLFSIVPGYRINNDPENIITAFLVYPMRQYSDEEWDDIVKLIAAQVNDFQDRLRSQQLSLERIQIDRPVR